MKRKHLVAAGTVAALLAISVYASPWWALHRMQAAVASHDADAVAGHVDFPALRESVKGQLAAVVGKDIGREGANPIAALGQAMALAFMNPLVDAVVSPAGVIAMMENGKISMARKEAPQEQPRGERGKPAYDAGYRSWDRFALTWKGEDKGSFIFQRHGLWTWKLAAIDMTPPR